MKTGKILLVGAGPGDPDLLTVRALRCLENADVVLYDRLIGEEIIDLIPVGVTRIPVGKASGYHSVSQDETNHLLVRLARSGRSVVRLKGGDPLVFGRGGEEALYLRENGIAFEIVPGITAAVACSAYAGIPLTHRGMSRGFRVVTGHLREDGKLDLDWRALTDPECTLVIYMGLANIEEISRSLISAGVSPQMPAAVVQNGTTTDQIRVIGTIESLPRLAHANEITPPALIIVGHTVSLAHKLEWYFPEENQDDTSKLVWAGC